MRRWVPILITVAMAAVAGCRQGQTPSTPAENAPTPANASAGPVAIEFWHTQTDKNAKALEELVKRFNAAHEGQVQARAFYQGSYNDLFKKVMAAILAKRPPDVAVAYESQVAEYMKAGVVLPLDDYLKGSDGIEASSLADIFPSYVESNRFPEFGDQLLSFPFTKSVLVLYYNEKALKEAGLSGPPKTWDEFRQAVAKTTLRDSKGKVTRYGFGLWADASTIDGCIFSRGGVLLSDDGKKVRFNGEPGREAFRLVADLVKQGVAVQTTKPQYPADFGQQRIAMFIGTSTAREVVIPAVAGKFPWGITTIPQKDPAKPVTVQYGANIAVFKTTPEKQRAGWLFVRWLTEPDQTAYWSTHSSYMPIRASVADRPEVQEYWKQDPQAKQSFEVARHGVREPNVRGWQDARRILEEAYDKVAAGTMTPEAALAEAEIKANKALAEKQ